MYKGYYLVNCINILTLASDNRCSVSDELLIAFDVKLKAFIDRFCDLF